MSGATPHGATWRFIDRVSRHLGPLLWDTARYLWRMSLDTLGSLRILFLYWRARRNPARAAEYAEQQGVIRARRAERWATWRALTSTRRIEVRAAAVALALIVLVVGRGQRLWPPQANPFNDGETAGTTLESTPQPAASSSSVQLAAAAAFRSEIESASPRQWSVMRASAIEPSERGDWDDFRVGSPVVLKYDGASTYRMWYVGCRLAGRTHDCGVGHATSADGVEWARPQSPVFIPPDAPATHWLSTLAIARRRDRYLMWYSIDGDPFADRPRGTLHMATSGDGLVWENVGQVLTTASDETRTITHTVHDDGRLFHLWFFDIPDGDGGEALVHFTSPDGRTWTSVGGDSFDGRAGLIGRPWVTSDGRGGFRALLVDRREGLALRWLTSADGTAWIAGDLERDVRVISDGAAIVHTAGLLEPRGLWLWLTTAAPDRRAAESIGVAFKKGSGS